jgi:universal stress protein A
MYQHILVAIDLSKDSDKVIDAAKRLSGPGCTLSMVHVVEPIAAAYSMDIYALNVGELQQEAINFAEKKLQEAAAEAGVAAENSYTLLGAPAPEIRNLAEEKGVDCLVIGSHGHSGWKLLLGSTANKVLHGATFDVLTVHVGNEQD